MYNIKQKAHFKKHKVVAYIDKWLCSVRKYLKQSNLLKLPLKVWFYKEK